MMSCKLPMMAFFLSVSASFSTTFWVWAVIIRRVFSDSLLTTMVTRGYTLASAGFHPHRSWQRCGHARKWTHLHEFKVSPDWLWDLGFGHSNCLMVKEVWAGGGQSFARELKRWNWPWSPFVDLVSREVRVYRNFRLYIFINVTWIVSPGAMTLRSFCNAIFIFSSMISARTKTHRRTYRQTNYRVNAQHAYFEHVYVFLCLRQLTKQLNVNLLKSVYTAKLVELMVDLVEDEGFVIIRSVVLHYFHHYRGRGRKTNRHIYNKLSVKHGMFQSHQGILVTRHMQDGK